MYGDFNAVQLLCIAIERRDVLSRVRLIIRKHLHELHDLLQAVSS